MKAAAALFGLLATASAAAVNQKVTYDGYKVFRIPSANKDHAAKLEKVTEQLGLQPWQTPYKTGTYSDVAVPPAQLAKFHELIDHMGPIVMHEDLGSAIAQESNHAVYAAGSANASWFNSYHSYKDHLTFLSDLQAKYPSNSEIVTSGKSAAGNAITGLHIYGKGGKGKPAVVFHGTVHAREWIGTMVNEYILYNILTGYGTDNSYLDKYDFYIFPVVNPDGFIYTQTTDRMWRKNRVANSGSNCAGTDLNRNWPYKWNGQGSSTNPCSETYRGSSAGSSVENKALTGWLSNLKKTQSVKLFIDWHSYSQLFMSPYGYSCTALPGNNAEVQQILKGAVAAIRNVHGTSFDYGPICSTIYAAAGNSVDWTSDVLGSTYNFAIELRDTGNYGFVLPPDQIVPSGEESYAGIRYVLDNIK